MPLTDLPVELLLDHVLPALDLPSLLALAQTSKFFSALCSDDTFWRLKLRRDYNFTSNADTARESGWKVIYKGIRRPSVYTWGNAGQGRLGVKGLPKQYRSGVPFPVKVNIKARIVSLVAGGWSFHALDDAGRIYVWGQLQGEGYAMRQDGFSESVKGASTPHRLQVNYPASKPTDEAASHPVKFTALSCGRAHSAALDSKNNAWLFTSWGRPIELTSPLIHDTQNPDEKLVQVECGWGFVSMLNESGTVYVLWPLTEAEEFKRVMDNLNETLDESGEHKASAIEVEGEDVIPCSSLAIAASPLVLPPIPDDLPDLSSADPASESFEATVVSGKVVEARHSDQGLRLVRIGAGDDFLVGLTNKGHVLSIDLTGGGDRAPQGSEWLREQWRTRRRPGWVYLPQYSDVEQVKQNPVFASDSGVLPPTKMKITHIAAHYNSFTAYSVSTSTSPHASLVLLGKKDTTAPTHELTFPQTIYPSLLQESIIALQLGDYHQAALTSNGKLYTWGKFSDGALGLGDPVDLPLGAPGGYTRQEDLNVARDGRRWATPEGVSDPSAVRFDHLIKKDDQLGGERKPSKKFVVSVAASGWHTGALVIDLDGDTAEENAGLKGKAVVKNDDAETFDGWYPPPVGRPMPGGWPHQLPSTGVPHAPNQPPAEHDSHDPYSTFETPGFNPHPSGNPATSSSAHHPLPGHGPAVQRDGAGGGPPLAPRFGLALERGRGGLRGHVGRVPPGLAAFMPQHPPAPPGPEGYPEHRGSEE